jgi:uncharacterized repeat protein (TIGR02543 family)
LTTADTFITITYQTKTVNVPITVEIDPATRAANLNGSILSLPSLDDINQKITAELEALQTTLNDMWSIYNQLPQANQASVTNYARLEAVTVLVDALSTEQRDRIHITFKSFDGLSTLLTRDVIMSGYYLEPYNRTPIDFISALETTGKFIEGFYDSAGNESDYFTPTDNAVVIRVKFYETKKITVTDTNNLNWKLTFSLDGDNRGHISGEYYPANGTEFHIPVSSSVMVISLDPRITNIYLGDITPNAQSVFMGALADNCNLYFTSSSTSVTLAYIVFTEGDSVQHTFDYTVAEIVGDLKLVDPKLGIIANTYEGDLEHNVVTYTYLGNTYTFAELADITFVKTAGAVNIVTVNIVFAEYFVNIYLEDEYNSVFDDVWNPLSPFLTETLMEALVRNNYEYLTDLVYYKNANRTVLFTDFDAKLTSNINLYAATRGTFTISFDTGTGATPTNSVLVVPGLNGIQLWNTLNSRTSTRNGYAFMGWSMVEDGTVLDFYSTEWTVVSIYNKPITLYAIWQPVVPITGPTSASLLGKWYDGGFNITFDANGNGTLRENGNLYNFVFISENSGAVIIFVIGQGLTFGYKDISNIGSNTIDIDGQTCAKVTAGVIEITVSFDDGSSDVFYCAGTDTLASLMSGGYNYYHNMVLLNNPNAVLSTLATGDKLHILALTSWLEPTFVDLVLDGGTMPEGYLPYIWMANWGMNEIAAPTKDGYIFVGWYTAPVGGERISDFELLFYEYSGLTALYAHYYEGASVNYEDERFAGTWEFNDVDWINHGTQTVKVTLTLNADGTFSLVTFHDKVSVPADADDSGTGVYRYINGEIVIISFTGTNFPEISLQFIDFDIVVISSTRVLGRNGVTPTYNYSGSDRVGAYQEGFISILGSNGVLKLHADGTLEILAKSESEWYNAIPGNHYFRIIGGRVWWVDGRQDITDIVNGLTKS